MRRWQKSVCDKPSFIFYEKTIFALLPCPTGMNSLIKITLHGNMIFNQFN